ncbi:MAG: hypothetical protein ACE5GI_09555 [Candidatus Aminicenantales bacterium]
MPEKPIEVVLFDQEKDPYQLTNIAEASPGIAAESIQKELGPWMEKKKSLGGILKSFLEVKFHLDTV